MPSEHDEGHGPTDSWGILEAVLDRPRAQRQELLEEMCADPGLRAWVIERLEALGEWSPPHEGRSLVPALSDAAYQVEVKPGDRLAGFQITRFIARGGMGQVWEAEELQLRRPVALKLVPLEALGQKGLEQFVREARAGARLGHRNVVPTFACGTDQGFAWLSMALVPGGRTVLEAVTEIDSQGPNYRLIAQAMADAARGLAAAHDQGIVHRDVKPANLLVDGQGVVRVSDFGLARISEDSVHTIAGQVAGTWLYMSPEQVAAGGSEVDHRTDVFSLGVVLYELLSGVRPFQGDTPPQVVEKILHHEPPPATAYRSRCPRDLSLIAAKAIEKRPASRYPDARELLLDLERYLAGEPIVARPPSLAGRTIRWVRRHPALTAALVLAVSLLGVSGYFVAALNASNAEAVSAAESAQRTLYALRIQESARAVREGDLIAATAALADCSRDYRGLEWSLLRSSTGLAGPGLGAEALGAVVRGIALYDAPEGPLLLAPNWNGQLIAAGPDGEAEVLGLEEPGLRWNDCEAVKPLEVGSSERIVLIGQETASEVRRGIIRIVDAKGAVLQQWVADRENLRRMAVSSGGEVIFTLGSDDSVLAWSPDGAQLGMLDPSLEDFEPTCFTATSTGEHLVCGDRLGRLGVWEWRSNAYRLLQHACDLDGCNGGCRGEIRAIGLSGDGRKLLVGYESGVVRKLEMSPELAVIRDVDLTLGSAAESACTAIALYGESGAAITGYGDGRVAFWGDDGREILVKDGHYGQEVRDLVGSPQVGNVWSLGRDRSVRHWQWPTTAEVVDAADEIESLAWAGTSAVRAQLRSTGVLEVVRDETVTVVGSLPNASVRDARLALSADGLHLLVTCVSGQFDGRYRLIYFECGTEPRLVNDVSLPQALGQVSWLPDASAFVSWDYDGRVELRDRASLKPRRVYFTPCLPLRAMEVDPSGQWILLAHGSAERSRLDAGDEVPQDGVSIVSVPGMTASQWISFDRGDVTSACWSPDGSQIALVKRDALLEVRPFIGGAEAEPLQRRIEAGEVSRLIWLDDPGRIAAIHPKGIGLGQARVPRLSMWDSETAEMLLTGVTVPGIEPHDLLISPDGQALGFTGPAPAPFKRSD